MAWPEAQALTIANYTLIERITEYYRISQIIPGTSTGWKQSKEGCIWRDACIYQWFLKGEIP